MIWFRRAKRIFTLQRTPTSPQCLKRGWNTKWHQQCCHNFWSQLQPLLKIQVTKLVYNRRNDLQRQYLLIYFDIQFVIIPSESLRVDSTQWLCRARNRQVESSFHGVSEKRWLQTALVGRGLSEGCETDTKPTKPTKPSQVVRSKMKRQSATTHRTAKRLVSPIIQNVLVINWVSWIWTLRSLRLSFLEHTTIKFPLCPRELWGWSACRWRRRGLDPAVGVLQGGGHVKPAVNQRREMLEKSDIDLIWIDLSIFVMFFDAFRVFWFCSDVICPWTMSSSLGHCFWRSLGAFPLPAVEQHTASLCVALVQFLWARGA